MSNGATLTLTNFNGLLTCSPVMLDFMAKASRVAKTDAAILIRGQTGTGKELVARYIHLQSRRSKATFSALNCAALSRELMASELFGHKRGAFTGATHDRAGLFKLTDGGTLFLDEIAEMPLDIQAGLLRVLQDQCFTPLGASEALHTNIRILSATHQSLKELVQQKLFREDLMYRVRVVPLYLPSLAERTEDIIPLAWHFLTQLNQQNVRQVEGLEPQVIEALSVYAWPGNVRELMNVCAYMHAIGEGPQVSLVDLPADLFEPVATKQPQFDERQELLSLLQELQGNRQAVADALGISRVTLWRKMKQYQL